MIEGLDVLRSLTLGSIFLRFLLASVFGGIIGLERGRRQHAAGLRTHMMVCIGAASTMMVSEYMTAYYYQGNGDILRLGAQVISGIGFLGAGTIIVTRQNRIRGLTTAASLWASACMGLAIGCGFYEGAIIMMAMMLFVLVVLSKIDNRFIKAEAQLSLYVEIFEDCEFSIILKSIKEQGWNIQEIRRLEFLDAKHLALRIDLLSDEQIIKPKLELDHLRSYEQIHYIEVM